MSNEPKQPMKRQFTLPAQNVYNGGMTRLWILIGITVLILAAALAVLILPSKTMAPTEPAPGQRTPTAN